LYSELYFALGTLLGFIYTLAIATIMISFRHQSKTVSPTLGDLRRRLEGIQQDIQDMQSKVWNYGSTEEEKSRRWRVACLTVAGKAVAALQSCWLEREQDTSAQAVYDELLLSLKSVGVEEINPSLGEKVEENDRRYRIRKREGFAPYKVSKVLYPGYYFRPTLGKISEGQDKILLEPALIEVEGEKEEAEARSFN